MPRTNDRGLETHRRLCRIVSPPMRVRTCRFEVGVSGVGGDEPRDVGSVEVRAAFKLVTAWSEHGV